MRITGKTKRYKQFLIEKRFHWFLVLVSLLIPLLPMLWVSSIDNTLLKIVGYTIIIVLTFFLVYMNFNEKMEWNRVIDSMIIEDKKITFCTKRSSFLFFPWLNKERKEYLVGFDDLNIHFDKFNPYRKSRKFYCIVQNESGDQDLIFYFDFFDKDDYQYLPNSLSEIYYGRV